jgi:hypothetical protein
VFFTYSWFLGEALWQIQHKQKNALVKRKIAANETQVNVQQCVLVLKHYTKPLMPVIKSKLLLLTKLLSLF